MNQLPQSYIFRLVNVFLYHYFLKNEHLFLQDFHEQNQKLLLWLAAAETRRHQAQVKDPNADPHRIQESRKELMVNLKEKKTPKPEASRDKLLHLCYIQHYALDLPLNNGTYSIPHYRAHKSLP